MAAYQGGKKRLGKELFEVMDEFSEEVYGDESIEMPYLEPFCGMCGVLVHVAKNTDREITASDINKDIILMWKALQKGWIPPSVCTREIYDKLKRSKKPSAERGFIGVTCSFGAQFFGGNYRPRSRDRNFITVGKKGVMDAARHMEDVHFVSKSYDEFDPKGTIVYCDPPYRGNNISSEYFHSFDHERFWDVMRMWSKNNMVFISETSAPKDFVPIWEKKYKVSFLTSGKNTKKDFREKLYIHKSVM
jgi:DNA adenine methylase